MAKKLSKQKDQLSPINWLDKYEGGENVPQDVDAISGPALQYWQIPIKQREDFKGNWLSYQGSGGKRRDSYGNLGDLYRYYAGDNLKNNVLYHSKYKPTNSKNPNAKYISIKDPDFINRIVEQGNRLFIDKALNLPSEEEKNIEKAGKKRNTAEWKDRIINDNTFSVNDWQHPLTHAIGRYFVSKGKDDKGEYLSYYDVFDTDQPSEGASISEKIGATKPFEIYDRIYIDKDENGKYIPRKDNYKDGGNIMSFFQQGLDWKPKSISANGDNIPSQREYEKQYAKWLENKRRREASQWAKENVTKKADKFAEDYVLPAAKIAGSFSPAGPVIGLIDAYNAYKEGDTTGAVIGAGMEALPYGLKGLTAVNKMVKNVINPNGKIDNFVSEIDWAKWNPETPNHPELIKEYNTIEKSTKKAGTWMKNSDGSAFQGTPEQFVQQQSSWFKKAYPEGVTKVYRGSHFHVQDFANRNRNDYATFFTDQIDNAKTYTREPNRFHSPFDKSIEMDMSEGVYEIALPNHYKKVTGQGNGQNWRFLQYDDNIANNTITNSYAKNYNEELVSVFNKGKDYSHTYSFPKDYNPTNKYLSTDIYANYVKNPNNIEGVAQIDNVVDTMGDKYLKANTIFAVDAQKVPIKSLRHNVGFFDMTNPNIYKSLIPAAIGAGALTQQKANGGNLSLIENNQKNLINFTDYNSGWLDKYQ